jgi:hypothetical protein
MGHAVKFNINNYVRVRLTDAGRARHRKNHEDRSCGRTYWPPYRLPREDSDGWSEWQMWDLMSEFGTMTYNGSDPPFETEIEIILEPPA